MRESEPGHGEIEEDGGRSGGDGVGDQETLVVDVAVVDVHDVGEAVGVDFVAQDFDTRLVVLEAADFAGRVCVCWVGWVAVEDGAGGGVGEAAASGAGLDEGVAGFDVHALQDVGVVGGVDDLGAVV